MITAKSKVPVENKGIKVSALPSSLQLLLNLTGRITSKFILFSLNIPFIYKKPYTTFLWCPENNFEVNHVFQGLFSK